MTASDSARSLPSPPAPTPLLEWLLVALATNRTRVKQALKHGQVTVNGAAVTRHDHVVQPGDALALLREGSAPRGGSQGPAGSLPIVYQDDAVVVVDKPAGLLSVATESEKLDTAFVQLKEALASRREGRPYVVHRLDRETSGLLLFGRSEAARDRLQDEWEEVEKTYLAVVEGSPRAPEGRIETHLLETRSLAVRVVAAGGEAKRAATRYRVLGRQGRTSLVEVVLETGRKHQIRVHLAHLGHPIVGDPLYGAKARAPRLGLHAWRLAFPHPTTGEVVAIASPEAGAFLGIFGYDESLSCRDTGGGD